jgi:hypothetical protein
MAAEGDAIALRCGRELALTRSPAHELALTRITLPELRGGCSRQFARRPRKYDKRLNQTVAPPVNAGAAPRAPATATPRTGPPSKRKPLNQKVFFEIPVRRMIK